MTGKIRSGWQKTLRSLRLGAIALALFSVSHVAKADTAPVLLGSFGAWKAYAYDEAGAKVCFMAATPQKDEGKYTKRGKIYAMVTHRPKEQSRDVFSYIAGYPYKTGADIIVNIGAEKFILTGQGENAWTTSDELDHKLTLAIQRGSTMIVEGISGRGTKTKDTFSLKGSGDAYAAIGKACGF